MEIHINTWAPYQTAKHAKEHLRASPVAGFLVGGISSGANFAGVIAYTARDAGLSPPITGLFISIPVALMPKAYGLISDGWREQLLSLEQNGNAPLLTQRSLAQIEGELICSQLPCSSLSLSTLIPIMSVRGLWSSSR